MGGVGEGLEKGGGSCWDESQWGKSRKEKQQRKDREAENGETPSVTRGSKVGRAGQEKEGGRKAFIAGKC